MELRQLRYFVRLVELGSMTRAARELGIVPSALSQQMSRLEGQLEARLLQRSATGVSATDAGMAFYKQAKLTLRHADEAIRAARQARMSGHVSVGFASVISAVLAMPFHAAMRERHPDIRLHLVESLSTSLAAMLNARQLDMAVIVQSVGALRGVARPLVGERLVLIISPQLAAAHHLTQNAVSLKQLGRIPLVLGSHGLRDAVDAAFAQAECEPNIVLEIDGLPVLVDSVLAGIGGTILSMSAALRLPEGRARCIEITDLHARRVSNLVSLGNDELSPAALAARVVLCDTAEALVRDGRWPGAELHKK